jgi:putative SOS response-associated peptidase YedK
LKNPERRCPVPVTDFCESEGDKGSKLERWFLVSSLPIFAFARVWGPTEAGKAFAFLTCEPTPIHPKPITVSLHFQDYDRWLGDDHVGACELAQTFPSQLMAVAYKFAIRR